MLRLMEHAHPHPLECGVILAGTDNPEFTEVLKATAIPIRRVGRFDVIGLAQCFRDFRSDVAYLFGQVRTLPWTFAARLAGVSVAIGAERSAVSRKVDKLGRRIDRYLLDAIICNSKHAFNVLHDEIRIPARRLFLVYNGLDESQTEPSSYSAVDEMGQPSIICIANLLPLKGHRVLLEAITLLRSAYPNIRAVLLGKDQTHGKFFDDIRAVGLQDTYSYLGFAYDVRGYLARADLFVLPSLYYEGTSTAILEAMAAGVPVIATDVGGTRELIVDGQTGLLVPPGDAVALAHKIQLLQESDELRCHLREQAKAYVVRHHSMQSMIDGHVAAFEQVLAHKRVASG